MGAFCCILKCVPKSSVLSEILSWCDGLYFQYAARPGLEQKANTPHGPVLPWRVYLISFPLNSPSPNTLCVYASWEEWATSQSTTAVREFTASLGKLSRDIDQIKNKQCRGACGRPDLILMEPGGWTQSHNPGLSGPWCWLCSSLVDQPGNCFLARWLMQSLLPADHSKICRAGEPSQILADHHLIPKQGWVCGPQLTLL